MADKRISQLVDRGTVANNDVVPIVVSGATTTNKATISSIQTFMQGNLDLGVTSVGITLGSSGTDVSVSGSPITSSGNITINLPTASATNRGLLSAADWVTFNSKQDAGSFVTLDTTQTITAQKTFTTSGSSDTMIISHGSGSGFALDVLKAGNGEAIRVTKTSGSGNAMTISGGNFEAPTIVKTGGTSSQFLKADGSVDSNAYTTNTGTVTSVGLSSATSGVTIGSTPITTSGTITLAIATASGSQNGLLSSTDWTTFNNKQNALTNPVTGTGAAGQVAYWNGTNSQTGSNNLFWDNTNIKLGIGTNTPESTGLTIAGGGIIVSLDTTAARKVLELYANSTGAKVSSTYVGASSYGSLELLTSNEARLTISAAGATTLTGALNGTSASFNTTNAITLTASDSRIVGGNTTGRLVLANSGTSTYGIFHGSSHATLPNAIQFYNDNTLSLSIASTGAATFSSSVTAASFAASGQISTGNGADADILINVSAAGAATKFASIQSSVSARNLVLNPTNGGNVGIGTSEPGNLLSIEKSSNSGSGSTFPRMSIKNTLATQGDGSSTFNFADINISSGNDAVNMFLATTYAAGSWSPAGIINVATNHDLQIKTNNTERMRITSGGDVLIGATSNSATSDDGSKFVSNGRLFQVSAYSDNTQESLSMYSTTASAYRFYVGWGGTIFATNTTISGISDARLKENVRDLDSGLDKIMALKPRVFDWKEGKGKDIKNDRGFIAQEFEEVFPDLIDEYKQEVEEGEEPYKSVRADLIPVLVKAIQELKTEIDSLKNQIK